MAKKTYLMMVDVDEEALNRIGHTVQSALTINHPAVTVASIAEAPYGDAKEADAGDDENV